MDQRGVSSEVLAHEQSLTAKGAAFREEHEKPEDIEEYYSERLARISTGEAVWIARAFPFDGDPEEFGGDERYRPGGIYDLYHQRSLVGTFGEYIPGECHMSKFSEKYGMNLVTNQDVPVTLGEAVQILEREITT